MLGNFLSCSKVAKDPFKVQEGRSDFLQTLERERASSRLEGRLSWLFSSCGRFLLISDREFRVPLMCHQEKPVSVQVARVLLAFLSSRCGVLNPCLEPRLGPEVSSPVVICILGFLWSLPRGVRPRLEWRHARPISSRTVAAVSGFPSG